MWVRVEDDVPHHPKFLQIGPTASWFWLCGVCYASRYSTDGFISEKAISVICPDEDEEQDQDGTDAAQVRHTDGTFRGTSAVLSRADRGRNSSKRRHRLVAKLVAVGLWDRVDGGYQIHDYHDYNYTAAEVKARRVTRAVSGRLGGLAKSRVKQDATVEEKQDAKKDAKQDAKQDASFNGKQSAKHLLDVCQLALSAPSRPVPSQRVVLEKQEPAKKYPPSAENADYVRFRGLYPEGRRVGGKVGKKAFENATAGRNGTHLASLHAALEQHKRSEQWKNPRLIPLMTTWLNQERWTQTLPEPEAPPDVQKRRLTPFEQARRAGLK